MGGKPESAAVSNKRYGSKAQNNAKEKQQRSAVIFFDLSTTTTHVSGKGGTLSRNASVSV
jgi:hypothetical protein